MRKSKTHYLRFKTIFFQQREQRKQERLWHRLIVATEKVRVIRYQKIGAQETIVEVY